MLVGNEVVALAQPENVHERGADLWKAVLAARFLAAMWIAV